MVWSGEGRNTRSKATGPVFLLLLCCHLSMSDHCRHIKLTRARNSGLEMLICRLTTHVDVETVNSPGLLWYCRMPGAPVDEVATTWAISSIWVGVRKEGINNQYCWLWTVERWETSDFLQLFWRSSPLLGKVMPSVKLHWHSECAPWYAGLEAKISL